MSSVRLGAVILCLWALASFATSQGDGDVRDGSGSLQCRCWGGGVGLLRVGSLTGCHLWHRPESPVVLAAISLQVLEWRSSSMRSWTERCPRESPMGSCWLSTWRRQPASWAPARPTVSRPCVGPSLALAFEVPPPCLPSPFLTFDQVLLFRAGLKSQSSRGLDHECWD